MKSLFEKIPANEIIERVNKLTPDAIPEWGVMNVSQMLAHCTVSLRLAMEEIKPELNREAIETGKKVKERVFNTETFSKNLPTSKEFIVPDTVSFNENRELFLVYLIKFINLGEDSGKRGIHPYFGELSAREWGVLIWKHTNHHLIQFNV